jgi:hypothetical protein
MLNFMLGLLFGAACLFICLEALALTAYFRRKK